MSAMVDPMPKISRRWYPILVAATIVSILMFSAVPPNLLIISGHMAESVMALYAGLLLLIAYGHGDTVKMHQVGTAMAVVTFGGRGGGFIELSLDRGTWELVGAVMERVLIAGALVMWHTTVGARIATERGLRDWADE